MNEDISTSVSRIVSEEIGCEQEDVDCSCVAHVLETRGMRVFADEELNEIASQRIEQENNRRLETLIRVGRYYYLHSEFLHLDLVDVDVRHMDAGAAIHKVEEMLEGGENDIDEAFAELDARPDDPDSIEDLLLDLDA